MNGDGKCMADTVNPKWYRCLWRCRKQSQKPPARWTRFTANCWRSRAYRATRPSRRESHDRDDKLRSEVTQRTAELERQIGKTANTDRSFRDRLSGGWSFILAILLVLSFVADLYMRVKGH
jgi:hypothetical protein